MRISDWSSDVCSSDLRNGDEGRDEERAQQSSHGDGPCPDHLGDVGDCRHHGAKDVSAGKRDVDALVRIEVDPVPQGRIELHSDELDAVLVELHGEDEAEGYEEDKKP